MVLTQEQKDTIRKRVYETPKMAYERRRNLNREMNKRSVLDEELAYSSVSEEQKALEREGYFPNTIGSIINPTTLRYNQERNKIEGREYDHDQETFIIDDLKNRYLFPTIGESSYISLQEALMNMELRDEKISKKEKSNWEFNIYRVIEKFKKGKIKLSTITSKESLDSAMEYVPSLDDFLEEYPQIKIEKNTVKMFEDISRTFLREYKKKMSQPIKDNIFHY